MTARHTLLTTLFAGALLACTPALAQPVEDPFEAIVANPDGANTRLNATSIPLRNPTEDELRQYLEAFRAINLNANFTVDPRARNANLGGFRAKGGTKVSLKAGFVKKPGESEGVLRTLEMVPSNPMTYGPLRFNKMTLDSKGVLHFKLNLNLMGHDFWPQEMTVEKIYRDREGNTILETGGSGLAGAFGPDIRITPDGRVQYHGRGGFLWLSKKWKDVKDVRTGKVVRVPSTIPINRWPPRSSDILDWMPAPGATGTRVAADMDAMRPLLEEIPISELSLKFTGDRDPNRITLSNGEGHLDLSNHRLEYEANGRFDGRTYVSDPNKRNAFRATGRLSGEVDQPGIGKAKIERLDIEVTGEHGGSIPFENPMDTNVWGTARVKAEGELSDGSLGLPGMPTLHASGRTRVDIDAKGKAVLQPLSDDPMATKELSIDPSSTYGLTVVDGPVEIEGLETVLPSDRVKFPERMRLERKDDPSTPEDESKLPVVTVEGDLGTKMGMVITRAKVKVRGETTSRGAVAILEGEDAGSPSVATTLDSGAKLELDAYAFGGMNATTLSGGGANVTVDAELEGTGRGTTMKANGMSVDLPGATDVDARIAARFRHGTRDGNVTVIREVGARATATLRDGEGVFSAGLPGQPVVRGRLAPGTSVTLDTGRMRRSSVGGTALETEGYADGEKAARLSAHLILTAGSIAHRDLAMAFNGRSVIDLNAAVGFKVDPAAAMTPGRQPEGPITMDLDLGAQFGQGSMLSFRQGRETSKIKLGGNTRFTFHTSAQVDPATGAPTLSALDGVDVTIEAESMDLRTFLEPLGATVTATIGSRSTARIRSAKVTFLERGIRIDHGGITFEIAPGSIVIGR